MQKTNPANYPKKKEQATIQTMQTNDADRELVIAAELLAGAPKHLQYGATLYQKCLTPFSQQVLSESCKYAPIHPETCFSVEAARPAPAESDLAGQ